MFGVKAARARAFSDNWRVHRGFFSHKRLLWFKGDQKRLLLHFQLPNFAETLRSKGLVLSFAAKTDMFAATLVFGGFAVIFIQSE